jgi:hypothetical protein
MVDKEYSILVWNLQFFKIDEDGVPLTDNKGNVQLYNAIDYDYTYLADGLDDDDLEEVEP